MPMEAFLWMFLPVFVAGGSALLSYYVMQARMEVALAKERESVTGETFVDRVYLPGQKNGIPLSATNSTSRPKPPLTRPCVRSRITTAPIGARCSRRNAGR